MLVRKSTVAVTEDEKAAARKVLFGHVDGLGDRGRKQWRRLWNGLLSLEPGEMIEIRTHRERLGWWHRKHMAMESRVFEAQERFETFDQFRLWLKTGAGFVDWLPGPKGGVIPVPKSTSYAALDQTTMEQVHADMVAFLRTEHAAKALWPKMPTTQRVDAVELILSEFGAFAE